MTTTSRPQATEPTLPDQEELIRRLLSDTPLLADTHKQVVERSKRFATYCAHVIVVLLIAGGTWRRCQRRHGETCRRRHAVSDGPLVVDGAAADEGLK